MISTRRSFVKGLAAVVGAIPLPGMVKQLAASLVPEEQTLEDAEDILRGLIARCVAGPIDEQEASLVGSFLARMRPTDDQIDALIEVQTTFNPGKPEEEHVQQMKDRMPYSVRFICTTVKQMRTKEWFASNFKKLNKSVMPLVVEPFNDLRVKKSIAEQHARRNA